MRGSVYRASTTGLRATHPRPNAPVLCAPCHRGNSCVITRPGADRHGGGLQLPVADRHRRQVDPRLGALPCVKADNVRTRPRVGGVFAFRSHTPHAGPPARTGHTTGAADNTDSAATHLTQFERPIVTCDVFVIAT